MGRPDRHLCKDSMEQRGAEFASLLRGPDQSRRMAADLVRGRLSPGVTVWTTFSFFLVKRTPSFQPQIDALRRLQRLLSNRDPSMHTLKSNTCLTVLRTTPLGPVYDEHILLHQVWGVDTGKCLVTLVNTTGTASSTKTSSLPLRIARLAVSRCGRLAAFAVGRLIKVLDMDRLADRSAAAGPPGQPGAYLRQALRFVTSSAM